MMPLPAPTDDKEFERLLTDYAAAKFGISATLWGRKGQKQKGIDIAAALPDGNLICVQCKDYQNTKITTQFLDDCITEAENGGLPISHFVIAVACERDVKLQEHIVSVNLQRLLQAKFLVELVFWDDIQHFVKLNADMLRVYYPELYKAGMKDYPELIRSEEDLRLSFLNVLVKYGIMNFLEINPFFGVYTWQIDAYENFAVSMNIIMTKAITITSTQTYKNIAEFLFWSNEICNLITLRVHTDDGNFATVQNPFYIQNQSKTEKCLDKFRTNAERVLNKIK